MILPVLMAATACLEGLHGTVYARIGDALVVIDSVYPASAPAREFGRSRLLRVSR